ncbi:hypothetical protein [Nocardioides alcanivorans]|uniref:hypothetical protein n=1 Tax=Nocardioides alcanivorans TaxID=2897352 RepID=UPI001F361EB4|nr:hypothetical protein [Nocardioides alcanivorans]
MIDHTGAEARDRDLERDLDAAVDGLAGVRLGWGQVFSRSPGGRAATPGWVDRRGAALSPVSSMRRCADAPSEDGDSSLSLHDPELPLS